MFKICVKTCAFKRIDLFILFIIVCVCEIFVLLIYYEFGMKKAMSPEQCFRSLFELH